MAILAVIGFGAVGWTECIRGLPRAAFSTPVCKSSDGVCSCRLVVHRAASSISEVWLKIQVTSHSVASLVQNNLATGVTIFGAPLVEMGEMGVDLAWLQVDDSTFQSNFISNASPDVRSPCLLHASCFVCLMLSAFPVHSP